MTQHDALHRFARIIANIRQELDRLTEELEEYITKEKRRKHE